MPFTAVLVVEDKSLFRSFWYVPAWVEVDDGNADDDAGSEYILESLLPEKWDIKESTNIRRLALMSAVQAITKNILHRRGLVCATAQ